jgi:hypothetical protein
MSKTRQDYNDMAYLNTLSIKELENYYYCHPLHHYFDKSESSSFGHKDHSIDCPCLKYDKDNLKDFDSKHYCTSLQSTFRALDESDQTTEDVVKDFYDKHSLTVCENFPPSYTSKKDQFYRIKDDIVELRKSKLLMKQAMKDLDKLLDESRPEGDSEEEKTWYDNDDVYGRYISKSMEVRSLQEYLPRSDIRPRPVVPLKKGEKETKEKKEIAFGPTPVFQKDNRKIFLDKDLREFREKLKDKKKKVEEKKSEWIVRPKSAVLFVRK